MQEIIIFALALYCIKLWIDRKDAEAERDYEREKNKVLTQGR